MKKSANKMWGGRFKQDTNIMMKLFSESVSLDWIFYEFDIEGSIVYAQMLKKIDVLTAKEEKAIVQGLKEIKQDIIKKGRSFFDEKLEDVHMNIEHVLIKKIGDVGKKLHTGRSRNDHDSVSVRWYLKRNAKIFNYFIREISRCDYTRIYSSSACATCAFSSSCFSLCGNA